MNDHETRQQREIERLKNQVVDLRVNLTAAVAGAGTHQAEAPWLDNARAALEGLARFQPGDRVQIVAVVDEEQDEGILGARARVVALAEPGSLWTLVNIEGTSRLHSIRTAQLELLR
jgi:hypothetical protein